MRKDEENGREPMKPITRAIPAVLLIFPIYAFPAFAATIHVPADRPTIQDGIEAAVDGDFLLVAPGTYFENIDFLGKSIILQSESGADMTVIDGSHAGSVVTFSSGETEETSMEGFTIKNGSGTYFEFPAYFCYRGGGIFCVASSPTILDCTFVNNSASQGGGIWCWDGCFLTVKNCMIFYNNAEEAGGGICCLYSSLLIENCIITDNNVEPWSGGGMYSDGSTLQVENCIIAENRAGYGGGLYCVDSYPTITNCTISGNDAIFNGGGIRCAYYSYPIITNCILWEDSAPNGPEMWIGYDHAPSSLTLDHNDIYGGEESIFTESGSIVIWLEGNIALDPQFMGIRDYRLSAESPCIDAGNPDLSYNDKCFPPSLRTEHNDMGVYGGTKACCWTRDKDGDGFKDEFCGGNDCDDTNPEVYPGHEEVMENSIDDDCDGFIDELYYGDLAPLGQRDSFLFAADYGLAIGSIFSTFSFSGEVAELIDVAPVHVCDGIEAPIQVSPNPDGRLDVSDLSVLLQANSGYVEIVPYCP